MASEKLDKCCIKAIKDIRKKIDLVGDIQKLAEVVEFLGDKGPPPVKVTTKLYAELIKAQKQKVMKITKAVAVRTIIQDEILQHTTDGQENLAKMWEKIGQSMGVM